MAALVRTPAGHKGTDEHIVVQDGGYWVRLVTRQALDREGETMDHCVGDGAYDHLTGSECMTDDAIWSLRTSDGLSELTIRIEDLRIVSASGYSNHKPGRWACMQVEHLIAAFDRAGAVLGVARSTHVVVAPDGRTFREDRVPLDVQAALDETERRERERRAVQRADGPLVQMLHRGQGHLHLAPIQSTIFAGMDTQDDSLGIPVSFSAFTAATLREVFANALQHSATDQAVEYPGDFFDGALEFMRDNPPDAGATQ